MFYKLDENKKVIPCSRDEWANSYEGRENNRHVGDELVIGFRVSTVFLGLCHNFNVHNNDRKPIVFETMIFDKGCHEIYMKRYSTWQEAEEGHKDAVEWVKNGCKHMKVVEFERSE